MKQLILLALFVLLLSHDLFAKNIDLSTLPSREGVQLTIYNSEDLTLVRETRKVSIKKGVNRLQFSWANTKIDPTSVQLNFLSQPEALRLTNTTFPHDKPQMLYWHLQSDMDMLATVEISYFTSGITWKADYTSIISQSGLTMSLENFITVTNRSGEDYEQAQVRLVVGKINLVERVEALVRQSHQARDEIKARKLRMKNKLARGIMSKPAGRYQMAAPMASMAIMEDAVMEEKEVEKESLSEYYIFSIEGTETIPDQWAKRLRSHHATDIKLDTIYRYRPREYGSQLSRIYEFKNDKKSSLGESPLPEGTIQIYQNNRQGSLTYIAQVPLKYTSIGEKVKLNSGNDPRIYFKLVNLKNWRDNIWMRYRKGQVYRRIDDGLFDIDHKSTVAGWDEHSLNVQHLRNFSEQPIKVEIRRVIAGDAAMRSELDVRKHDFQTIDIHTIVKAGEKQELLYETSIKKGRNFKQNQVVLETKSLTYPTW
jgi:hypothetical protein